MIFIIGIYIFYLYFKFVIFSNFVIFRKIKEKFFKLEFVLDNLGIGRMG